MKVYRTITENSNGRIKDETSPTGYVRRVGQEMDDVIDGRGRKQKVVTPILKPCEAPRTVRYGDESVKGGTIHTVVEDVEPVTVTLTDNEVKLLVGFYVGRVTEAANVLLGGYSQMSPEMSPVQAIRQMQDAIDAADRLGADLRDESITLGTLR